MPTNQQIIPHRQLPAIVILDITFAGFGIARSMHRYGIPMYGVSYKKSGIDAQTSRIKELVIYEDEADLVNKLVELSKKQDVKPVLYLANDHRVEFVIQHFDVLNQYYQLELPSLQMLEDMLDKNRFMSYAIENNLQIPRTIQVRSIEDAGAIKEFNFPIILKPNLKTKEWHENNMPKAIKYNTIEEFNEKFPQVFKIQNDLTIQEFIEGDESNIFFCCVYYNKSGELKHSFSARKIRQWIPVTGSTACLRPVDIPEVKEETIRFFDKLNYKGIGSMEYKLNPRDGKYYIIEPTVGRYHLLAHAATVAGVNLALDQYCDVTGYEIKPKEKRRTNFLYILETSEMQSAVHALKTKQSTFRQLIKSYKGKRHYHYMSYRDLRLSSKVLYIVSRYLMGQLARYLLKTNNKK